MSTIRFNFVERWLVNIRLLPKIVLLMVGSTVLLTGKQLFDAHLLQQNLLLSAQQNTQQQANTVATLLNSLYTTGQLSTLSGLLQQEKKSVYVLTPEGQLLGNPRFHDRDSWQKSVGGVLSGWVHEGNQQTYLLNHHGWVIGVELDRQFADQAYQDFLLRIVWQTLAMIVLFIGLLVSVVRVMHKQINYLTTNINAIANKDLTLPIVMPCRDEFGDMAQVLERTRLNLHNIVAIQTSTAQELTAIAEVMSIAMSETGEATKEEFAEIDQLASAMSEMSSTVQNVAQNTELASKTTTISAEQAKQGAQFVGRTTEVICQLSADIRESAHAVNQVEERVGSIGSVVSTIRSISEQTNLLALNAAIEAARAGEQGRGFAVVADEVRQLAQRTQTATVEIQEMISQLQSSASQAVEFMEQSVTEAAEGTAQITQAGSEFTKIEASVLSISEMNFEIASSAQQQSTVAQEMSKNLSNVRELILGAVTVMTELTETADAMQSHAEKLQAEIGEFRFKH
ncbi:MAG: methyl-accepting chemotaxis protein [Plesiomonas sp.]|uniref:methyl-accepting chemotaxis protein n=1 Tax=Plesiomonas sp. TaxID=2486279 RepID=UPI003F37F109